MDTLFNFYHHDPDRFYKMYAEGRIDQDEWALSNLREMMRNCSVIPTAEAERALIENTHLRSGLEECVSDLTSLGIRCAILSTGNGTSGPLDRREGGIPHLEGELVRDRCERRPGPELHPQGKLPGEGEVAQHLEDEIPPS